MTTTSSTPTPRCVMRFDDRDDYTLVDESEVPELLDSQPFLLDRIRYTVNVTDETNTVTATTNHRLLHRRGSGKVFGFWSAQASVTITTTKAGLILCRERRGKSEPTSRYVLTADELRKIVGQLVDHHDQNGTAHRRTLKRVVSRAVSEQCGGFPDPGERWPLLAELAETMGEQTSTAALINSTPPALRLALLDATSWAAAVKNLFGVSRYRRSLTRAVTELLSPAAAVDGAALYQERCWLIEHLWAYRGLVPIDWIIDTLTAFHQAHGDTAPELNEVTIWGASFQFPVRQRRLLRAILRQLPSPVLRRLLADTHTNPVIVARVWNDLCTRSDRDITVLSDAVVARRQRNIRDVRDLEQLILRLPKPDRKVRTSRSSAAGQVLDNERYQEEARDEYNHFCRAGQTPVGWDEWMANRPTFIAELNENEATRRQENERANFNEVCRAGQQPVTREEWIANAETYRAELAERMQDAQDQRERERRRREEQLLSGARTWVAKVRPGLNDAVLPDGFRVVIATDDRTLSDWAVTMSNCIDAYACDLDSTLLGAIVDGDGTAVANFQIVYRLDTDAGVLDQIFGRFNRGVLQTMDQHVVDGFLTLCEEHNFTVSELGRQGFAA